MISKLQIQVALQNGKTSLKNSFCTQPFKLANITEDRNDTPLQLMIMSSSPGILDNDKYKIKIELQEGTNVELETQSYQRLFQMKTGAVQEMEVRMGKNSSFIFLPHPSVPHEGSVFSSKNTFYLEEQCFLIWGEVLTCGRKLNGEIFRFSRYHSQTKIFFSGQLVVKENLLIAPPLTDVKAIGQMEGFTHQSSFICICTKSLRVLVTESIHELLLNEKDICFGVSDLPGDGFIIRFLGYRAEQIFNIHKIISSLVLAAKKEVERIKTPAYAE